MSPCFNCPHPELCHHHFAVFPGPLQVAYNWSPWFSSETQKFIFHTMTKSSPLQTSRSSGRFVESLASVPWFFDICPSICDSFILMLAFLIIIKWLQQFQTFHLFSTSPGRIFFIYPWIKMHGLYSGHVHTLELTMVARGRPFVDWLRSVITEARDMQLY